MAKKTGKLKVKCRKYAYGCQIIKLEKMCFDWVCDGHAVTRVDDGFEITENRVKHRSHIVKRVYFKRPYDYKKNFLFRLTEFLSNIVSFFRVVALNLLVPAIIVGIILLFAMSDDGSAVGMIIGAYIGVYGGLIGASLLLAGLGALWRKLFKLTEETDKIQEANGFMKWSEYEDDESTEYYYNY